MLKEDFKEYTIESKDLRKEYDQTIDKLEKSIQAILETLGEKESLIIANGIVQKMIHVFYASFLDYFESKLVELGDFISESEGIIKFAGEYQ